MESTASKTSGSTIVMRYVRDVTFGCGVLARLSTQSRKMHSCLFRPFRNLVPVPTLLYPRKTSHRKTFVFGLHH